MKLPYDQELQTPESISEWVAELDVELEILELERYPARPLLFSEYLYDPPKIVIYRYLPMEDWLNLISQQYAGYYGPWYYLHLVYQVYMHLEMQGYYEIERKWYHYIFGNLSTIEKRAYRFVKELLGTLHNPAKFDEMVEKSFRPGGG